MEILERGTLKTYIFECPECGCIFVANSSEVEYYHTVALITLPYMHCPHCLVREVGGDEVTEEQLEDIKKKLAEMGVSNET